MWYLPKLSKLCQFKPCFKKGDKSKVSNYRPISLLAGFSKVCELLIFHRLKHHLVRNNFLANEQFGFRDNVSTDSVILNSSSRFLMHGIIKNM